MNSEVPHTNMAVNTMAKEDYIVTIGLEVHAQLTTQSKMFCGCPVNYGEPPNSLCCPVCLGLPGALPVLNQAAIEKTLLTGLMLDCSHPPISKWDRKNYFYADMPKNYQTSQFDLPLCIGGGVPLYDNAYPKDYQKKIDSPGKVVKLTRIHLEEDVGKSTHHGKTSSVDFNRAGTPLMEIVSDPDLDTPEEAVAYLNSLRQILVYGGVSHADMEKGQMRCDVNISLRPKGTEELGAKIELKNLNSISAVRRSIYYEIDRQAEELDMGIEQIQSTRRWDDDIGETSTMRTKEDAHDYRYFPCPDLLPMETAPLVEKVKPLRPELPHEKRERFVSSYGISEYDASVLASEQALADYFEKAATDAKNPKKVANWVINDLLSALNKSGHSISECPLSPESLDELVNMIVAGEISHNQGKEVFIEMYETQRAPKDIAKEKGFEPMKDDGSLDGIIDEVIAANEKAVEDIKGGNTKSINFLTGQVMKATKGKANPKAVSDVIEKKLLG